MNAPAWTAPALVLGVVLMIAPWLLPSAPAWTDADAKAREQTWAKLHGSQPQDFAAAKAAYDAQQARFDAAVARPKWIAFGLRTIGVLLAAIGVVGYVNSRRGSR